MALSGAVTTALQPWTSEQATEPTPTPSAWSTPATRSPAPLPANPPAQTAPAVEVLSSCPDGLSRWSVSTDAAAGQRVVQVRLRNCDQTPLTLSQLPAISATNARGNTWNPINTTHAPTSVLVGYQREAAFTIQYHAGTIEAGKADFARSLVFKVPGLPSATWTATTDLAPGMDATLSAWQLTPA